MSNDELFPPFLQHNPHSTLSFYTLGGTILSWAYPAFLHVGHPHVLGEGSANVLAIEDGMGDNATGTSTERERTREVLFDEHMTHAHRDGR